MTNTGRTVPLLDSRNLPQQALPVSDSKRLHSTQALARQKDHIQQLIKVDKVTMDPVSMEPVAMELVTMEPVAMELVTMEPVAMEPVAMELVTMEPVAMEPVAMELVTMEPVAMELVTMEPVAMELVIMEPVTMGPTMMGQVTKDMGPAIPGHSARNYAHIISQRMTKNKPRTVPIQMFPSVLPAYDQSLKPLRKEMPLLKERLVGLFILRY